MTVETQRLELYVLDARQIRLWTRDLAALERELNCTYQGETLEGQFLNIVEGQVSPTEQNSEQYYWHSFWLLIRKSDRVVVGSADFKSGPDIHGEIEIGYGLGKAFQGSGYMTEAVSAMCDWALRQDGVIHVTAETERNNYPSQHVLQRCGFIQTKSNDTLWWKR